MSGRHFIPAIVDRFAHPVRHWRSTLLFWSIALLVVGAAVAWNNYLEDQLLPRRWGVVEEGRIYRSGLLSMRMVGPTLRKYGIRVVVSLDQGEVCEDLEAERLVAANLGVEQVVLPLAGDGRGDIRHYAAAIKTMADARRDGKPVLVRCVAGAQRTGGVVAMWRVLVENKPPAVAYAEMVKYGYRVKRNPELLQYLNEHMAELADLLVQQGVIDRPPDPLPRLGP